MLSHKPWSGQEVLRLFLGVFSTFCLGNIIAGVLYHFKMGMSEDTRRMAGMIISLLFLQIAAVIWVAYFLRESKMTWKQAFGFGRKGTGFAIGIGVLAGMLILPIAQELILISEWIMLHLNVHPEAQAVVQELQKPHVPPVQRTFIALLAIVTAPFVEETLFRGLLYPTIKQAGFPRIAFLGTSILFAAFHLSLVTFIPLTFFAMVLILLYESTDNLLAPIAAHATFNFANFLLLAFQDVLNSSMSPT